MKRSTLLLSIMMMIFTVTGFSAFAQPGGGMTIGGPVLTATKTTLMHLAFSQLKTLAINH
jgi:hypothetical protein